MPGTALGHMMQSLPMRTTSTLEGNVLGDTGRVVLVPVNGTATLLASLRAQDGSLSG
jgi:hypothetical protein